MAAEYQGQPAPVTLLYEPAWPGEMRAQRAFGWRRIGDGWERRPAHDAFGAQLQEAVARYYLTGYTRAEMARELGYSERQCQAFIGAATWPCYVLPVLAALKRLGISQLRGSWQTETTGHRSREIVRAQAAVLDRCRLLLGGARHVTPAFIDELQADLRLLAIVTEDRP